ncbi:TetR/AcrR family transcriptional regulator [Allokutzneria sp. NRRL B-24872]|uniref:TetR/AcrR family transcriptional regulator n=1 Tax=Allokutzneria sp. NRRL B-24872 TaxID=1137961 RepID=UPI000A3B6F53|nr:TetR/AcrR family transcriptional regulator [Allokutzneria sp. NRRL B-24872]
MPKIIGGSLAAHREQTRQRIFEAFAGLMYERGFDRITLADIASAAGVGRTAMYNHFPDKEALLVAYAAAETESYVVRLRTALSEVDDPVRRLATYVRFQLREVAAQHLPPGPALRSLLPQSAYGQLIEHVRDLEQELRAVLRAGIDQGYLPEADVDGLIPLINACLSGGAENAELTTLFVLRAVGARLAEDGSARKLPRRR